MVFVARDTVRDPALVVKHTTILLVVKYTTMAGRGLRVDAERLEGPPEAG